MAGGFGDCPADWCRTRIAAGSRRGFPQIQGDRRGELSKGARGIGGKRAVWLVFRRMILPRGDASLDSPASFLAGRARGRRFSGVRWLATNQQPAA